MPEFIDYDQLYLLLNKKFKATHAELRYWIKCHLKEHNLYGRLSNSITPFASDIRGTRTSIYPSYFYPECYYYDNEDANLFVPLSRERFVTVSDLVIARNWIETSDTSRYTILRKAAEMGMLRYYDKDKDQFTHLFEVKLGGLTSEKKWHETEFIQNHLEDPKTFFLLEDILKIERFFFKKPLALCVAELGLDKKD